MSTPETWCIFDTETTGLIHNDLRPLHRQPRCIEFAAVLIQPDADGVWHEVDFLDFLCDPAPVKITDEITRITGIKPADVVGAPRWADKALEVAQFFDRADGIAGHNLAFDTRQVAMENARSGRVTLWPEKKICTVEGTEHLFGEMGKLSHLFMNLFNAEHPGGHRAVVDVRATARAFAELKRRGEI